MKRFLCLVMALMCMLTVAAQAEDYKVWDEEQNLEVILVTNDEYNVGTDTWVIQKIRKTTNVSMNIEKIGSTAWVERKNLIFAADELPELFISNGSFTDAEWNAYYSAKQLRSVDDMIENMPNYTAFLDKYSAAEKFNLYDADGNMMGFSAGAGDTLMAIPGPRAIINTQWLENVGMEMPKNFDEFVEVLRAFRDNDVNGNGDPNDEYPLSGYNEYGVDAFVAMPLGISVTWSAKADWIEKDGDIEYLYTDEVYREYLERMRLLYSEKLLDNEYYTQNRAQMLAKGANMQVGVCTFNAPFVLTGDTNPELYEQYSAMIPMESEYAPAQQSYNRGVKAPTIYVTAATENNGKLEIVEGLVDFFWTSEYATYGYGPEKGSEIIGDWDGVGGVYWNEDHTKWNVEVPEKFNGVYEYVRNTVHCLPPCAFDFAEYGYIEKWDMVAEDVQLIEIFKPVWEYIATPFPPALSFTADENEEKTFIETEIKTYVQQMEAKFVMGEETLDDDSWEAFKAHIEGMDIDVVVGIYKDAYARYQERLNSIG